MGQNQLITKRMFECLSGLRIKTIKQSDNQAIKQYNHETEDSLWDW